jgi:hypothetical protein
MHQQIQGALRIDNFIKIAIQESILDIEFANRPGAGDGNAEHQTNHSWLENLVESLIIVNVGARVPS